MNLFVTIATSGLLTYIAIPLTVAFEKFGNAFSFLIFYIFVSYEENIPFLLAAHYCQLSNVVIYTHLQTVRCIN